MNDVIWDIRPGQMTRDEMAKYRRDHNMKPATFNYSEPEPTMQVDVMWNAIWDEIKTWDINVPTEYGGYCGATGNHVTAVYVAVKNALQKEQIDRLKGGK